MTQSTYTFKRTLLVIGIALSVLVVPTSATAATPELLWQVPEDGKIGAGSGQLDHPNGIAADPISGHIYIADRSNARVSEFDAWGQFVKAWGWGVANGANELQTCGPQANPPTAGCLKGIAGSGPGQFGGGSSPGPHGGIAVDAAGDVYVGDLENFRVEKFDSEGNFLLMFGGEVNETTSGNVCTAASGHTCGKGIPGEGDGHFTGGSRNYIATGPAGTIFVGDNKGRIQEFEPNGAFKSKVILEGELNGSRVTSLAVDGSGNFYVIALAERDDGVRKFSPSGALLDTFASAEELKDLLPGTTPANEAPVAVDADGNVYTAVDQPGIVDPALSSSEVVVFDPIGNPIIPPGSGFALTKEGAVGVNTRTVIIGLATNTVTTSGGTGIYLAEASANTFSFASAYGPPPDKWAPPVRPPEIISQYAVSVDSDAALLRAQISPLFWSDTSYYVEYGTGKCADGGCTTQQPLAPGSKLGAGVVGNAVNTKGVLLSGLMPETTYHYRFVAQSSGGGPVRGVGGKVGVDGTEGTFTTPVPPSPPNLGCGNAPLRVGSSAFLPDCRAYEMVSPVDKNGADVVGLCDLACYRTEINQASTDGNEITYSSYKAFGDALGGPFSNQYIARRGVKGWTNDGISPPYSAGIFEKSSIAWSYLLQPEFRAFSADLKSAWLVDSSRFTLTPDAQDGFFNVYQQNTDDGGLIALTTTEPKFATIQHYELQLLGRTLDGEHVLLSGAAALTPNAAASSGNQLYVFSGGELHLVSVLPDGTANPDESFAGTAHSGSGDAAHGEYALAHAIADDGSRVFWSSGIEQLNGVDVANLYLRVNPEQPQSTLSPSGKCTQPARACTFPVSTGPAEFLTADPSGSKALFSEGENLYVFDAVSKVATPIANKVMGVLGASEDLSSIYFVSTEALAPGAVAGQRNLYLDREGTVLFVAALSSADTSVAGSEPSDINPTPVMHTARVTPDGGQAVFMSTNSLTGYDNADVNNGKAASEVHLYDADAGQLHCVSCNATGARPDGEELKGPYQRIGSARYNTGIWAAAWLNTAENSLHTPRALSDNGSRLFFNSFDALVSRDTNGAQDVYQWEAPGTGDCATESPFYSESNGGCVSLISSGESPEDSEFVDASPDGSDVFFKTQSSLDPADPGLIDIYDARVDGGYPPPPPSAAPCLGDGCQSAPAPPDDLTPASIGFRGPGNPTTTTCPRGKKRVVRSGRGRCVPRKHRPRRHGRKHRGNSSPREAGR